MRPEIRRIPIFPAKIRPSSVTRRIPNCHSTSPGVSSTLNSMVMISRTTIAFSPLTIKESGTFDSRIMAIRKADPRIYPQLSKINRDTIYTMVPINFTLGSSLCRTDSAG